jgi:hypothetical protein
MLNSNKQHLLIDIAIRKPFSNSPILPESAVYDNRLGAWMIGDTPAAQLMDGQVTKKCDQETGEDQKGE